VTEKLSVFITTYNEESNIGPCIDSVGDLADEILVLDNASTDRTVEIARSRRARIEQRPFDDFSTNRNAGLEHLKNLWVLVLDADERLTDSLREEIRQKLSQQPEKDAYAIRRDTYFQEKKVRCWSGGWVLRFFRKDKARYSSEKTVHEELIVRGNTGRLKEPLQHFTFKSFGQYLPKLQLFATMAAQDAFRHGKRASWIHLLLYPPSRFLKTLVLRGGLLDGIPGFQIAYLSAYSAYLKFAKLRELQHETATVRAAKS
jgi:glycosyltransferase involved in cell wall biosynthesis